MLDGITPRYSPESSTSSTFRLIRWRIEATTPGGLPYTVELRAPSEAIALDRFCQWKPEWTPRSIDRVA